MPKASLYNFLQISKSMEEGQRKKDKEAITSGFDSSHHHVEIRPALQFRSGWIRSYSSIWVAGNKR